MKKELTEKERSLLDYICSKYSLDFSGCKARKTKTAAEAGGMEGKSKNRVSSKLGCGHDRYEGSFQAGWMVL